MSAAHDLVIRGGTVVDGTGSARGGPMWRSATVASSRSARSTPAPPRGRSTRTDLVVAPGFIDIHTHYDAQAFWDTTLSPSPLHGVTTVMGGNCGFTIAPLAAGDGPVDPAMPTT